MNLTYVTLWTRARSGLLISMLEKLSQFRLIGLKILVLLMWKWMGLFLRKNNFLRWGSLFLLNLTGALTLSLLLNLPSAKLEPWFVLWSFFLLRLLCISINLPCGYVWNTVVMFGLEVLVATSKCWKNYKNGYARLLLLPLLNPQLIVEMYPVKVFSIGLWYMFIWTGRRTRGRSTSYSDRFLWGFFATIPRCYKDFNSSFPRTARLWLILCLQNAFC